MTQINAQFSCGNIKVIDDSNPLAIELNIVSDNQSEFKQWFYFKAHTEVGSEVSFTISDAKSCAYPDGWVDYKVCASYDGEDWFRIPTQYENGELVFGLEFDHSSAFFAYFPPYSYQRHMALVHSAQLHPLVEHRLLGQTLDGRDINLLQIGDPDAQKVAWIIARQHPGETMAEWFIEGFLRRILDDDDPVSQKILSNTLFYVVPNMNPDGSERGHLRTNSVGVNLNREWLEPSMEKSPEVYLVREEMKQTGVDLFLDVHGDEGLPYNFVAACEGIPSYDETRAKQEAAFIESFKIASPDFQDEFGYSKDEPGKANLSIASSWVGEQFGCLSLTLEMPFKDNADLPDDLKGWSIERCHLLGEAVLHPILNALKQ